MVLGLIQYGSATSTSARRIGKIGHRREPPHALGQRSQRFYLISGVIAAVAVLFGFLAVTGTISVTLEAFALWLGYGILVMSLLFFTCLIFDAKWAAGLLVLWLAALVRPGAGARHRRGRPVRHRSPCSALFVAPLRRVPGDEGARGVGGEAAADGDLLALPPGRHLLVRLRAGGLVDEPLRPDLTDRVVFGWEMPTSWLQNVNPLFIVDLRADLRLALDLAGAQERQPVDPGEVLARPAGPGGRLLRPLLGRGERHAGEPGGDELAGGDLLPPHGGRALPLAGGSVVDDQARARRAGSAR